VRKHPAGAGQTLCQQEPLRWTHGDAASAAGEVNSEIGKRVIFAFAASVIVASVVLSGSRTGILVVLIQLILFGGLLLLSGGRLRSRMSLTVVVCAVVLVAWIAGGELVNQTVGLRDSARQASKFNRIQLARDSVELVKQAGMGT